MAGPNGTDGREGMVWIPGGELVEPPNGARAKVLMPTVTHVFTGIASAVRQMQSTEDGQRHFQGARLFSEVGPAREAALHPMPEDLESPKAALETNRQGHR